MWVFYFFVLNLDGRPGTPSPFIATTLACAADSLLSAEAIDGAG